MNNEEPEPEAATEPSPVSAGEPPARPMTRTERRLRKLAGRKSPYEGPIVAIARAWVSRDGRMPLFAARFLDFAVLTPDHLVLCSTGFFTRRPRGRVFRESLGRLEVTPIGRGPVGTVRVTGNFNRPIRLELRDRPEAIEFAHELLARTKSEMPSGPLSGLGPDPADVDQPDAVQPEAVQPEGVQYEHTGGDPSIEPPHAP